jgi:thiosulfate/3-mercaptopyruvate sulfurtransferase
LKFSIVSKGNLILSLYDMNLFEDCRDAKAYSDGHIPGAIHLGDTCATVLREKETATVFRIPQPYEKKLGDAGISNDTTVVVYADAKGIKNATVGFWVLEYLGQKDVRFLHGGIEAWKAAGKKLETKETKLQPTKYTIKFQKNKIATTEEVLKIAKGEVKGPQIVDSRTGEEYAGTNVRAKRGGHISLIVC